MHPGATLMGDMPDPRDNIHFVFVRPCFASNLGSSVRVMKNMGFRRLILVQPECEVGVEARAFAMKGAEILDEAEFYPSLEQVAGELGVLVGTTGRFRQGRQRLVECAAFAEEILPQLRGTRVGVVFGSENNGLRRDELRWCQWLMFIPAEPDYPVMNLAQAVAVVAYQLRLALMRSQPRRSRTTASPEQIEALLARMREFLEGAQLPTRVKIGRLMTRLHKIAAASSLEREDVNMLHGLIKELERRLQGPRSGGLRP